MDEGDFQVVNGAIHTINFWRFHAVLQRGLSGLERSQMHFKTPMGDSGVSEYSRGSQMRFRRLDVVSGYFRESWIQM